MSHTTILLLFFVWWCGVVSATAAAAAQAHTATSEDARNIELDTMRVLSACVDEAESLSITDVRACCSGILRLANRAVSARLENVLLQINRAIETFVSAVFEEEQEENELGHHQRSSRSRWWCSKSCTSSSSSSSSRKSDDDTGDDSNSDDDRPRRRIPRESLVSIAKQLHKVRVTVLEMYRELHGRDPPQLDHDEEIVEQVMTRFNRGVKQEAVAYWDHQHTRLAHAVQTLPFNRMLRWEAVTDIPIAEMDGNYRDAEQWGNLTLLPDWKTKWAPVLLTETNVGTPNRPDYHNETSYALVRHTYNLMKFQNATNVSIDSLDFIFEFGGGAGGMAYLFHRLGFRGIYVILDFPAVSAIQEYFLRATGMPVITHAAAAARLETGVFLTSNLHEVESIIQAHVSRREFEERSLFVATWSLSESPPAVRTEVVKLLYPFAHHFIVFQDSFQNVENMGWFHMHFMQAMEARLWWHEPIPGFTYNNWLFGTKYVDGKMPEAGPLSVEVEAPSVCTAFPAVIKARANHGVAKIAVYVNGVKFTSALVGWEVRAAIPSLPPGISTIHADLVVGDEEVPLGVGVTKEIDVQVEAVEDAEQLQ